MSIKYNHKNKWFDITSGFIHTLCYSPPRNLCLEMGNEEFDSFMCHELFVELWECEIPKDTIYFQADTRCSYSETNNSYASNEIKLIKLIKRFEFKK